MKQEFEFDLNLLEKHPAVKVWNSLCGEQRVPSSIDKLGERSNKKSLIYRLNSIGYDGSAIIAKRSFKNSLSVESFIYKQILPILPINHIHCYGYTEEEGTEYGWLFLEEARGGYYNENNPEHNALAAEWLASLHIATAAMHLVEVLPPVTAQRYLCFLNWGKEAIERNLKSRVFQATDQKLLNQIIAHSNLILNNWGKVENFCKKIPPCLVHSDFISKNVRVNEHEGKKELLVMDWEASGWGIPLEDIGGLDIETYWSIVEKNKFSLSYSLLQQLGDLGLVFRYLAWIAPTTNGLTHQHLEGTMYDLAYYEKELSSVLNRISIF